jgi:hypothetical protein
VTREDLFTLIVFQVGMIVSLVIGIVIGLALRT